MRLIAVTALLGAIVISFAFVVSDADADSQSQAVAAPPPPSAHDSLDCFNSCHSTHNAKNISLVRDVVNTPNSGARTVNFLAFSGLNSFADGDATYDGICEVCHTTTRYHRNDGTGDDCHFAGIDCTTCHRHQDDYQPNWDPANHPQATTDCSNCHDNQVTGMPDLIGTHGSDCCLCHVPGSSGTILGPIGSWNGECSECHNPGNAATGNLATPTKGHRCIVCHGDQETYSNARDMHEDHADKANCVVCHGNIPDVGTAIGSGNRQICDVCHTSSVYAGEPIEDFHEKHAEEGLNCLECHGGVRPPVDTVVGTPVGSANHVCAVCHTNHDPSNFVSNMQSRHKRHADANMDCGACHMDAHLQDDRDPMPPLDDSRRAMVPRAGTDECTHCHNNTPNASVDRTHEIHLEKSMWCYTCHEGTDLRPIGQAPPVTQPTDTCNWCHTQTYNDPYPFDVHETHSKRDIKCYACHQGSPLLFNWPSVWMSPTLPINITRSFGAQTPTRATLARPSTGRSKSR